MVASRPQFVSVLRDETVGGGILLIAAAIGLIWANSPWSAEYLALSDFQIGPSAWHLDLTLAQWAADGLLALFFFVVGLELKHEFVLGALRRFSTAIVPVAAALGGMIVPAALYLAINATSAAGQPNGWGIPMATDIAFALAVLAVAGRRLPVQVRIFLLTLAVADDLGAILVIALFYSSHLNLLALLGAVAVCAGYWWAQRARITTPLLYVPLAAAAWMLVHASGVHATIAGVALGLLTRVRPDPNEVEAPAERLQERLEPISAGFCVPVFAFFSAGVVLTGTSFGEVFSQPVTIGIVVGLVVGKPVGILGAAWLTTRLTPATLAPGILWRDLVAVGFVAGIGFTVSLLITELAFPGEAALLTDAKVGVLAASAVAAVLGALALVSRGHRTSPDGR